MLPLKLYDIDKKELGLSTLIDKNTFYFYSFKNFNVSIHTAYNEFEDSLEIPVKTNCLLFSVTEVNQQLNTVSDISFNNLDNFGYTLYIPDNNTTVVLKISDESGTKYFYTINLQYSNILTDDKEHYNDLLVNYYLPTFEELKPAIFPGFDDRDLIKRLLLDFRGIVKRKGTKASIEKFFNFIGIFNIQIFEEYLKLSETEDFDPSKDYDKTISPDKLTDIKTGDYHVIYYNFKNEGLNEDNLPIRKFIIEDLQQLFECLAYAIPLANKYFTLTEQEIVFFGIAYSSNVPIRPSIQSTTQKIFKHDVHDFRKDIEIDVIQYTNSENLNYIVRHNFQEKIDVFLSEIKFICNDSIWMMGNMYFIDKEIFDDDVEFELGDNFFRVFGSILHLDIKSPNTTANIFIRDKFENTSLRLDNVKIDDIVSYQFVVKNPEQYYITIEIFDGYGNKETYNYEYFIGLSNIHIDFDMYNSIHMKDLNDLILDIESPSVITNPISHEYNKYVLNQELVPEDLSTYFDVVTDEKKFLSDTKRYLIDSISKFNILDNVTETIPLELTEQWMHIIAFPYDKNYSLKLRIFNPDTCLYTLIEVDELPKYGQHYIDNLIVGLMDIVQQIEEEAGTYTPTNIINPYYFISTNETGIDLTPNLYDLVLVNNNDEEDVITIYSEITDKTSVKIPVNYDFPLFFKQSKLVPDFKYYIAETDYKLNINGIEFNAIKSMFNRMGSTTNYFDNFDLKLGDVIIAKLNSDYVVNFENLKWTVYDAFTNKILFQTSDLTLKYRINDYLIYNIGCEFSIGEQKHSILKPSIFSSFKKTDIIIN